MSVLPVAVSNERARVFMFASVVSLLIQSGGLVGWGSEWDDWMVFVVNYYDYYGRELSDGAE